MTAADMRIIGLLSGGLCEAEACSASCRIFYAALRHTWVTSHSCSTERTACELRHVRLLQHVNICCSKTIYAAGGDVTQRRRHTPRRLLRMRAAAYCSILHYAAGTEQASDNTDNRSAVRLGEYWLQGSRNVRKSAEASEISISF